MSSPDLHPHAYVLVVHDLEASTAYLIEILGFSEEWRDADTWRA